MSGEKRDKPICSVAPSPSNIDKKHSVYRDSFSFLHMLRSFGDCILFSVFSVLDYVINEISIGASMMMKTRRHFALEIREKQIDSHQEHV